MNSLKRSQKLCIKCQEKNPIRTFKCKKCGYEFPQKQKKELCSNQQSQLDQYLMKKTLPKEPLPIADSFQDKRTLNSVTIIIDGTDKNNHNNILCIKDQSFFTNLKTHHSLNQFIKINSDTYDSLIEIIEDKDSKCLKIKLIKVSNCINYSFDCLSIMSSLTCLIGFICKETNKIYFCLSYLNQLTITSNHIFTYEHEQLNNNKQECSYYSIKVKIVCKEPFDIFSIVIDHQIFGFCYYQVTDELIQLFTIKKSFPVTLTDIVYDAQKRLLNIILCDNNNQIFYYTFYLNTSDSMPSQAKLITVFENHFQNKITDLRFLKIKKSSVDNMTYFSACSRDGVLKIIDINNIVIFKHKTHQTWINQICFDSKNDIMFFLTNYDDKIVGIKLSNKKEPIIKRINNTDNPLYALVNDIDDKLYYLDSQGCVYSIKTFLIEDMFKTSKCKKKNEYDPKKVYQLNDWEFTKEIRMLHLYDKNINMGVIAQDQLGTLVFTQVEAG